ncbi:hypothetical protein ABZT27_29145 [Streptomyces sp. NPDC005389]|uniref:hypothetical protein n=1 Tax=Streptomyces sp. NPDC005389 TaxID=3157040 RepID=UPI0033AA55FB
MADERYQWLDQEAAERLLRGEPVEAVDDHARSRAERLAGALDAARTLADPPAARTELPGEAAALAAFRAAHAERAAAAPAAEAAAGRTEQAELGRVRLAPVPAPRPRWGRSLRYGLAAAVAAVTVGGVAVAAGTGVLPMVGGPAPASSVTAGEHADPLVSEDPGIRKDPEAPTTEPDGDRTPGASPSAGTTPPSTGAPDGQGTGTEGPGTPKPGRSTPGTGTATDPGGPGGSTGGKDGGTGGTGGDPSTTAREKVLKACRAFRSGQLDATGRKGLTSVLRDGETLRRYCDRILGGTAAPQDGGGKDGSKDESDDDPKGDDPKGGGSDRGSGDRDGRGGDRDGRDRRDTARSSAPDTAGLTAVLPLGPLGIGVGARVPLPV